MRVLVLGRSGQVATELTRLAAARGIALRSLDRAALDLSQPQAVRRALPGLLGDAQVLINATAWTAVDAAETDEPAAARVNAEAPGEMARVAAAAGLPFLHVSTDYVFDGSGTAAWTPDDTPAPLSAYGRSKLAGETAVREAGGVHAILRTSWVFSAQGGNFVKTMLRLGRDRAALNVVADQIGGPTPAAAIAAALLDMALALHQGRGAGGTYHFAGGPDTSWAGFAREIFARAGLPVRVDEIAGADWPTPAPRPGNSRLDCTTLEQEFGIARPDWRDGLDQVLAELARKETT